MTKTITTCDNCQTELPVNGGPFLIVTEVFPSARAKTVELEFCDAECVQCYFRNLKPIK